MKKSVVFFLIFWGLSFLDAQNCSQSEPNTTCYNNYQSTESSVGCAISNANNELLPDLTVSWWMMQEYFINGKFDSGPFEYPSKDRLSVDLFIPNIGNGPMLAIAKGEFVCVNADEEFASDCSLECNTGDCNDASAIVSSVNCNCPEEFQREKVYQRVLVKDGDAMVNYDRFIGYQAFHNDEGHDHFHVDNWIELSLRIKDDTKPSPCDWDIVAESSKIGFCIGDIDWVCTDPNYKCYSDPIPPTPQTDQTNLHDCPEDFPNMNLGGPFAFSNCNNILGQEFANIVERKMGISPGRADFYHKFLTDNWVQIPIGICNKEFWLVAEVNPQNTILEENSSNNCVAIPYQIKYNVDENTNIIENIHKSYCANDNTIELSVQKSSQIYSLKNGAIVTEDDYPGIGLAYDEPYKIDFTWSTNEIAESIVIGLADLDKDSEGEPITTTFTVTASNGNDLLPILENYCNVSVTKQITVSPQDFNEQSQGLTGTDYNAGSFNFTGTHYVAGTIIVNDGCTLNITDAKVHFARESGIIINPGGRINIERSVLTNFPCNDSPWDGIFVNGNALEDHPTTLSSAIHHGVLQINSSIIENAKIGINNWKFYKDTYEAGIVIASNSQFINNGCSIKLTSPSGSNNLSSISRCNFYNMNEFFPNATNVTYSDIAYGHDPCIWTVI